MGGAWDKVRGEMVGLVGLLGDVMEDGGASLRRWSARHMFTPRERTEWEQPTTPASNAPEEER